MALKGYEFASLSHNDVDEVQNLEENLNSNLAETNPNEEVVLIAFKKNK